MRILTAIVILSLPAWALSGAIRTTSTAVGQAVRGKLDKVTAFVSRVSKPPTTNRLACFSAIMLEDGVGARELDKSTLSLTYPLPSVCREDGSRHGGGERGAQPTSTRGAPSTAAVVDASPLDTSSPSAAVADEWEPTSSALSKSLVLADASIQDEEAAALTVVAAEQWPSPAREDSRYPDEIEVGENTVPADPATETPPVVIVDMSEEEDAESQDSIGTELPVKALVADSDRKAEAALAVVAAEQWPSPAREDSRYPDEVEVGGNTVPADPATETPPVVIVDMSEEEDAESQDSIGTELPVEALVADSDRKAEAALAVVAAEQWPSPAREESRYPDEVEVGGNTVPADPATETPPVVIVDMSEEEDAESQDSIGTELPVKALVADSDRKADVAMSFSELLALGALSVLAVTLFCLVARHVAITCRRQLAKRNAAAASIQACARGAAARRRARTIRSERRAHLFGLLERARTRYRRGAAHTAASVQSGLHLGRVSPEASTSDANGSSHHHFRSNGNIYRQQEQLVPDDSLIAGPALPSAPVSEPVEREEWTRPDGVRGGGGSSTRVTRDSRALPGGSGASGRRSRRPRRPPRKRSAAAGDGDGDGAGTGTGAAGRGRGRSDVQSGGGIGPADPSATAECGERSGGASASEGRGANGRDGGGGGGLKTDASWRCLRCRTIMWPQDGECFECGEPRPPHL